jgi:hypothetical protein
MIKNVCVFCGSSDGKNSAYLKAAANLGALLAKNGVGLVYGGGKLGLMGELSRSVIKNGGKVTGVIPKGIFSNKVINDNVTELKVTGSMHERKAMMSELSDAYIALPGGIGTIEELAEVITWSQLEIHKKPIGIINIKGYFDGFTKFLDTAVKEGFLNRKSISNLVISEKAETVLNALLKI